MSVGAFGSAPFAAPVGIWFEWEHGRIELAQAGSTFIMARKPQNLPANCPGHIVIRLSGEETRRPVRLPQGMSAGHGEAMVLTEDPTIPF